MKITETNCETGQTFERDMTAEEQQKHEAEIAFMAEFDAQIEASVVAKENALAKLVALGLSEEEAASLVI